MQLSAGQQIRHYTLNYRLGQGGMAEVWAATNSILGVQVALKVLFGGNPILQQRLIREGRAQAALDHENILPVRDVIDVGGSLGLILPLIQGPSLDKLLQHYRPSTDETVALFRAIVEGVGHAHQHGLIHRDLKPGNILLEERWGRVVPRVADFGLVKGSGPSFSENEGVTRTNSMMGTLHYAAPEQLLDASTVDHRADLFSLGVILVEMLTGRRPFQASSLRELLAAYKTGPDLSGVPEAFQELCLSLLADDANHRLSDSAILTKQLGIVHRLPPRQVLGLVSGVAKAMREISIVHNAPNPSLIPSLSGTFAGSLFPLGASPSAHTPTPKNNLPAEVDAFIGREAALRTLSESLNESRLVSILGTAGMGKTRLALQFGQRHLLEYPGGVFFCDLSEVKTLEGILFAVSKAMDVPLGKGDPLKQLGHAIAGHRQCLFIFDNFEQLTEFASQTIKQWLERSAQARFVVTSRVLLGLSGEFPLRLVPLDEDEGVTLFVERAVRKKRGFTLTAQNRGAVHQLVRLLDGLPLAIELATCRIKVMRPQQILKRMNQRFKLLSAGNRNTARRQATLRAAIDWSWELLEDWEQAAFAQCAVFEDGFTLEAAEAVIDLDAFDGASPLDAPERPAPWPMDAVQSLVDKSLLRPLGENRRGEMRFGMLMSIHDYAKEKLGRMNDAAVASIRRRHASFFARFGAEGTPDALMRFDGVSRWWALRLEMDNLIAAHRFALDTGDVDDAISLALALSVIAQNQHPSVAISALNETLNLGGIQAASRRATVHRKLGWLLRIRGHTKQALVQYAQALSIHREVGNRDGESRVMDNLGTLYMEQGQMKQALVHYTQALSIHREIGNRFDEGNILNNMGILYKRLGQVEQAMKHYIQALSIHREVGNRRSEGMLLGNLGALYGSQGQLAEAKAYYTQALSIHREVGNRHSEGNILGNLGILYKNHGQLERALAHYTQALSIHREVGNRRSEGAELTRLGTLRMVLGQTAQAQAAYTQALEIVRDAGDRFGEGHLLCNLGTLQMQKGQLSEAQAYHTQALSIHREVGDRRNEGVVLGELGMLEVLEGKTRAGLRRLEQGEALLREANALLLLGILLCYRAHAEHLANHPDAAATALREAKQIADDLNVGSDSELGKKIPKTQAILDKPVPSTSI